MGLIINIVPGENATAPALIYFDEVDGKAYLASATDTAHPAQAVTLVDYVTDVPNQAWLDGVVDYSAGEFASGTPLYLGDTPGAIVTTPPANVQRVGAHVDITQSVFSFQGFEVVPGVSNITAKKLSFLRV